MAIRALYKALMAIKGLNYGPETVSTKGLNLRKFSAFMLWVLIRTLYVPC